MFCRDFEKIAGDLAAGRLMEAGKRERALHHASECSACALRLNAERTLEAGLRALAEGAEEEGEAPPHLKLALRAAFDKQMKVAPGQALGRTPGQAHRFALTLAPPRSRNLTRWLLATAAALILFAVAVALLPGAAPPGSEKEMSSGGNSAPSLTPTPGAQSPQRDIEPGDRGRKIKTYFARKTSTGSRASRRAAISDDVARDDETVTDYIPLTYLADATAVESGVVLRVELPPSALIAIGAPAPVERTDSRLKADVVIGDDGVARAVRFVRQDSVRR